ncbi:MAG: hypothetical protein HY225_01450, partial [Candidatus Vogelbacteria bacterium]|nr:hypothetical protein [Candidatus Vogelbacteria bacterium]
MDPIKIHTIVTHRQPHWDEAVAKLLLVLFGEAFFPGVSTAKTIFWNAGSSTPDGRPALEWEAEGYILVGVGGGRFDEHPSKTQERKKDCAATLVAKYLGVDNDPALKSLLDYTCETDLSRISLPGQFKNLAIFGIANLGKLVNRFAGGDDQKVLDWMIVAAEAQYLSQKSFFEAKKEFAEKAVVTEVKLNSCHEPLKVSAIISENTSMKDLARSREGNQSAVFIQQNSKGQIQIHTNTVAYKGLKIYDAVRLVRAAEFMAKFGALNGEMPT